MPDGEYPAWGMGTSGLVVAVCFVTLSIKNIDRNWRCIYVLRFYTHMVSDANASNLEGRERVECRLRYSSTHQKAAEKVNSIQCIERGVGYQMCLSSIQKATTPTRECMSIHDQCMCRRHFHHKVPLFPSKFHLIMSHGKQVAKRKNKSGPHLRSPSP